MKRPIVMLIAMLLLSLLVFLPGVEASSMEVYYQTPPPPQNSVCYGVADGYDGHNDSSAEDTLAYLNKLTGQTAPVGGVYPNTGTYNIEAIAFEPGGTTLYAANGDRLGTLDLNTGAFTPKPQKFGTGSGDLGHISFNDVDGLSFDVTTGVLYGTVRRSSNDLLFQIDTATGAHVPDAFGSGKDYVVIDAVGSLKDVDDIASDPVTGLMYASINDGGGTPNHLVILDTTTGAVTDLGVIKDSSGTNVQDVEGLSFFNDGLLYGTTGKNGPTTNGLWRIDKNTAVATFVGNFSSPLHDFEGSDCLTASAFIVLTKEASTPEAQVGETIVYSYTIKNTGGVVLDPVTLEDDQLGTLLDAGAGVSLAPGASTLVTATYTVVQSDLPGPIVNVATATGIPPAGQPVTDTDTVTVHLIGIDLVKEVNTTQAQVGETLYYTYTVTNIGSVTLSNVTLNDDVLGSIALGTTTLAPGASTTGTAQYVVQQSDLPGPLVNVATVTGETPAGNTVQDSDTQTVQLQTSLGSIGDFVWRDLDQDGFQDSGEPGIDGVLVELYSGACPPGGSPIATATTSGGGTYLFNNLAAGQYCVQVAGSNFAPGGALEGYGLTSAATFGSNPMTINLAAGQNYLLADFGYAKASLELVKSVSAHVVVSGTQVTYSYTFTNTGDTYLDQIVVTDNQLGQICPPPGIPPLGPGDSFTCTKIVELTDTGQVCNIATVSGRAIDSKGTPLDGFLTIVDQSNEVCVDVVDARISITPQQATNPVGEPHTFTVTVEQNDGSGWSNAPDDTLVTFMLLNNTAGADFVDGVDTCTTVSGQCTVTINATQAGSVDVHASTTFDVQGVTLTRETDGQGGNSGDATKTYVGATIGDYVWEDINGNGLQDEPASAGLNGVTVKLYKSDGTLVASTVTANDGGDNPGYYLFENVVPGDYYVAFTAPSGYALTVQGPTGVKDGDDSDPDPATGQTEVFSVAGNEDDRSWDAGLYRPVTVGDFAWIDTDGDGVYDAGAELPLNGVVIQVTDSGGNVVGTATTGSGFPPGEYLVDGLAPGVYTATVVSWPTGFLPSGPTQLTSVFLNSGDQDLTLDFPFINTTSVGILSLQVQQQGRAIALRWTTLSEGDNQGFHVWRATAADGPYQRLTTAPIPSQAVAGGGASYQWLDTTAQPGGRYWYRLETVPDGQVFGPVPGMLGSRIFLPIMQRNR